MKARAAKLGQTSRVFCSMTGIVLNMKPNSPPVVHCWLAASALLAASVILGDKTWIIKEAFSVCRLHPEMERLGLFVDRYLLLDVWCHRQVFDSINRWQVELFRYLIGKLRLSLASRIYRWGLELFAGKSIFPLASSSRTS